MTEKELIKNLAALKNISADQNWIKTNRDVLSYQIFNGAEYVAMPLGFMEKFSLMTKRLLQPTPIAALIALFFIASGVVGVRMSRNTMPGEPLYIAKGLSEKTQLLATFDETAKAKLNLEFASQRVAEMEKVMKEVAAKENNSKENNNDPRVTELSASFKKEIASAREYLNKTKVVKKVVNPQAAVKVNKDNQESGVVSAEAAKDDKGIDISLAAKQKTLTEAEKLFNHKNYGGAAEKLDELGQQLK